MNKLNAGIGVLLAGLLAAPAPRDPVTAAPQDPPAVVVGTYDSRAVLMAYVRSAAFQDYVREQKADIGRAVERARAAGDRALVADLEALGPQMQERVHFQGFGTAPIPDVIARIEDRLPAIAKQAGVGVIVSKWDLTYRADDAELVDVTDLLVAEFDPDEKTLESVRGIVSKEPIPVDELKKHKH